MASFNWRTRADLEEEARADQLAALRAERDQLLRDSDWTQMPDAPLDDAARAAWAAYRQALRDLPGEAARAPDPGAVRPPRPPDRERGA